MGDKSNSVKDVEALRREYTREGITEDSVSQDPVEQFDIWFQEALDSDETDANAMALSTATPTGKPSSRIVLLKGFDEHGFRFYSNYESRKGKELDSNPQAALCFYWSDLERQIRIEGRVKKLGREESADYFKTRPRESRIGAWASHQSAPIKNRKELEKKFNEFRERFDGDDIPLPDFWGGYILKPDTIEFWQGRTGRLHDRIVYSRQGDNSWEIKRLSP